LQPILERDSNLQIIDEYTRDIDGALVSFGVGVEVTSVNLVSDFSSIELSGLPVNADSNTVSKILADLYHPVDDFYVVFKTSAEGASVAEVRVEDPHFASEAIFAIFNWDNFGPRQKDFLIKDISHTVGNAAADKRIQLSTVVCTWYQSSRLAWLVYLDQAIALRVIDHIKKIKILGRTPDAVMQKVDYIDGRVSSCTICVRNLHGQTTVRDIRHKLFGCFKPENITLGKSTYDYSDDEAAKQIQQVLCSFGARPESFQYRVLPGSCKVKATATFLEEGMAIEVARNSGMKISELGNTKLFINHIVSVKYNISSSIVIALKVDLDKLLEKFAQGGYVQLRIYPQEDRSKSYTTIRLFWENLKDVSGAKIRLEKLLAGVVVRKGDEILWDPYFSTFAALDDLSELETTNNVYIFKDLRKSQLVIYGGTVDTRNKVRQVLIDKVEEMHQSEHILLLTPHLSLLAAQGGMRRLKAKFGDSVKLNVNLNSSIITITGSNEDFTQAQTILRDTTFVSLPLNLTHAAETCVICWTAAVEPVSTSCNHTYCKECFANQAASATGNEIPLRCFGAEGTCQQAFMLDELKRLLRSSIFESLLRTSFDSHVRTRPNDFQYCPTPDCPQVYRPETDYEFFCTTCLTPICTKCKVISHDGMTCEEWQEIGSEEGRLFRQYKVEHDVRDCPNCGVGIEKNEGCNHMECTECGAHICWFCMEVFEESGQCYGHMRDEHGNWYDEVD